jgi:DNA-binding transcriptional ArsR family regulator
MNRPVKARRRRAEACVIDRPAAIRLLASPLRQAMMDAVAAEGPLSVAELSRRLRRPADRLYYHVKRLAAVGLLVDSNGDGSRSETRFDVPGRPMYIRYLPHSSANRRAVVRVVEGMLRAARRDFARGFRAGVAGEGPHRRLWASRVEGTLTSGEIARLNRLLSAALALVLAARRRGAPTACAHQLTWVSSPIREL